MFGQLFCLPPNTHCPLTQWHLCTFSTRSYFCSFPLLCLLCFKFGAYIVQQNIIVFLLDVLVWHGHIVHYVSLLFHGNSGYANTLQCSVDTYIACLVVFLCHFEEIKEAGAWKWFEALWH